MEIIGVIIAGIIIGLLGKFVAPGDKDNIPLRSRILGAASAGRSRLVRLHRLGGSGSPGIDWVRWIIAIAWRPVRWCCVDGHRL